MTDVVNSVNILVAILSRHGLQLKKLQSAKVL